MTLEIRTLDATEAHRALRPEAVKTALRAAFLGLHDATAVQPVQTVLDFPNSAGDCIFYPALISELKVVGVKVSPYVKELAERDGAGISAFTLLLSTDTGQPVLLCDSLALTTARTAGTTAIALDYLMPANASQLAVVGAGNVAMEHLRYMLPARRWTSISIFSPSLAASHRMSAAVSRGQLELYGSEIRVASDVRDAVTEADVIMLCTSSPVPVIDIGDVKDDAIVTSISTSGPLAHEIRPDDLTEFDVFCDYKITAPATAGEMLLAQDMNIWTPDAIIHDLPELVARRGIALRPGRRYFRSTGLGIEDLAVASLLC
jgi:L-arginine dehydrogenase